MEKFHKHLKTEFIGIRIYHIVFSTGDIAVLNTKDASVKSRGLLAERCSLVGVNSILKF